MGNWGVGGRRESWGKISRGGREGAGKERAKTQEGTRGMVKLRTERDEKRHPLVGQGRGGSRATDGGGEGKVFQSNFYCEKDYNVLKSLYEFAYREREWGGVGVGVECDGARVKKKSFGIKKEWKKYAVPGLPPLRLGYFFPSFSLYLVFTIRLLTLRYSVFVVSCLKSFRSKKKRKAKEENVYTLSRFYCVNSAIYWELYYFCYSLRVVLFFFALQAFRKLFGILRWGIGQ